MKHLKSYNESLRDKMTGVKLTGDKKVIFDASEECDSMGLRPTDLFSGNGIYSFGITNYTHNREDVYIDIHYYSDSAVKKPYRWHITVEGQGINGNIKTNTWGEALILLIDILYPDIEEDIQDTKGGLNRYKNSDDKYADSWAKEYEFKLNRLTKALEIKTKYSKN